MSKGPEFLTFVHQVMTEFMNRFTDCDYTERQHSAKLKMRLSGLIRATLFFFFFLIKECLSIKICGAVHTLRLKK